MTLLNDIKTKLPKQMHLPKELVLLLEWIEEQGYVSTDDELRGYLLDYRKEEHRGIYFSSENREVWHFKENPQAKERFFPIAYIDDSDGCIGLWLDDNKKQHIVIVGNDNATPMLFCIVGEPITLLKFLAIGYDDIFYWFDYYDRGLEVAPSKMEVLNLPFYRQWIEETFNLIVPKTGKEVLPNFTSINDEDSTDIFLRWDREQNELWEQCRYKKALYDKINELFPQVNLKREGFYNYIDLSLFGEVRSLLESDDIDTTTPEIINSVKALMSWVTDTEQPEENYGCIHLWTEFVVSLLEHIYDNRKLHHLILHLCSKENVIKNKKSILGYMHVSEEDYLHVFSLFDGEKNE